MSDALRQLLAEFTVEFDKAGALLKGNSQLETMKDRLHELTAAARTSAKSVEDVFSRAAASTSKFLAAQSAAGLGGRGDNSGFGAAGAARASRLAGQLSGALGLGGRGSEDGFLSAGQRTGGSIGAQFGPTRETLVAARASMLQASAAAAEYATTLRGRLGTAIGHVRAGFNGGGSGGRGLLDSLISFRGAVIGLGAGAAARALVGVTQRIGDIGEKAASLGVTTDEFQRLDVLARQNNTSVEALGVSFTKLTRAAVVPTEETRKAFARLGVEVKDPAGNFKSAQDLFFETGEALADLSSSTERAGLGQVLLGEGAKKLEPLFAKGSAAFRAQREDLARLRVLTEAQIAAADKAADQWEVMKSQLLALAGPVIEKVVVPAMQAVSTAVLAIAEGVEGFVRSGRAGSLGLVGLALAAARLWPMLRLIVGLGGGFGPMLLRWGGAALAATRAVARLLLPMLALEDILGFFTGKDSLIGRWFEKAFGPGVKKTVDDLRAAFEDLWNWIFGNGTGERAQSLFAEISRGIELMINDLLAAIPFSGRTKGLAGLEAFEKKSGIGEGFLASVGGAFANAFAPDPFIGPDGAPLGVTKVDARQITTTVQVATGASPAQIAGAVSSTVARSGEADLAAVSPD